jgi:hypothetical protein
MSGKLNITREAFYSQAEAVRRLAGSKLCFGTAGFDGGIDGELSASSFWKVLQEIESKYQCTDPSAYGCDMGHGSGIACMAYFNGGPMSLDMVGIECNKHRYFFSKALQRAMFSHPTRKNFRAMAKKSQYYFGDGVAGLVEVLGISGPILHLRLFYWFREGWSPADVEAVVNYINKYLVNLEVFVCDMTYETLCSFGLQRKLLSSMHFSGLLNKSTNSRTLYIHHVQTMFSNESRAHVCTKKEREILAKFAADDNSLMTRLSNEIDDHWISENLSKGSRQLRSKRKLANDCCTDVSAHLRPQSHERVTSGTKPSKNKQNKLTEDSTYVRAPTPGQSRRSINTCSHQAHTQINCPQHGRLRCRGSPKLRGRDLPSLVSHERAASATAASEKRGKTHIDNRTDVPASPHPPSLDSQIRVASVTTASKKGGGIIVGDCADGPASPFPLSKRALARKRKEKKRLFALEMAKSLETFAKFLDEHF